MNLKEQLAAAAAKNKQVVIKADDKPKKEAPKAKSTSDMASMLKAAKAKAPDVKAQAAAEKAESEKPLGKVRTWSFSTLKSFEDCEWRVKLHKIDKKPQLSSDAADRGTAIHDGCEKWIRGLVEGLPADNKTKFEYFSQWFTELRGLYLRGKVMMEDDWGIRRDWSPCDWSDKELWARAKLDVFVLEVTKLKPDETADVQLINGKLTLVDGDTKTDWNDLPVARHADFSLSCRIIDFKSGRKFGNQLKHADQGLCYALNVYHRYPDIANMTVEFWYLDQADEMIRNFSRRVLAVLKDRYDVRANKLTTCSEFMPKANAQSCMFCPYGSNTNKAGSPYGTGICTYDHYQGIDDDDF